MAKTATKEKTNGNAATTIPPATPPAETTQLATVPAKTRKSNTVVLPPAIVRPAVTTEQAVIDWNSYLDICKAILADNDYTYYVHYTQRGKTFPEKPFVFESRAKAEDKVAALSKMNFENIFIKERKKRSACEKLARFYNLSMNMTYQGMFAQVDVKQVGDFLIETRLGESFSIIIYQRADDLTIVKASVLLYVTAPNGRTILGEAACSVSERKNGTESFAHADHDIPTTAFTRAFCRGVLRCIGTGEVSAEEFQAAGEVAEPEQSAGVSTASITPTVSQAPIEKVPEQTQEAKDTRPTETLPKAAADAPGVPKAEIPTSLGGEVKQEARSAEKSAVKTAAPTPAPAAKTSEAGSAEKFVPLLPVPASLAPRIEHIKTFLFGDPKAQDRTIEYLFFCVAPAVAGPVEIESRGNWVPAKWNEVMKKLEDRAERMVTIEKALTGYGKDNFLKWAQTLINTARGKKVFGSK
jgi:hypothetical protein